MLIKIMVRWLPELLETAKKVRDGGCSDKETVRCISRFNDRRKDIREKLELAQLVDPNLYRSIKIHGYGYDFMFSINPYIQHSVVRTDRTPVEQKILDQLFNFPDEPLIGSETYPYTVEVSRLSPEEYKAYYNRK